MRRGARTTTTSTATASTTTAISTNKSAYAIIEEMKLIRAAFRGEWPATIEGWSELLVAAGKHGMSGVVYQMLQEMRGSAVGEVDCVPEEMERELAHRFVKMASENLHTLHVLEGVLSEFEGAGVRVMVLKGAALLRTVYGELGSRPMSDVDLLVRAEDCGAAAKVLKQCGGRRGAELIREDFFPRFHYEEEWFVGGERGVRVDLHVRPLRPIFLAQTMAEDALWKNAEVLPIGRAHGKMPDAEGMLIHLCAHAAYHGFARGIWMHDIWRWAVKHAGKMDWARVVADCREWRLSLPVFRALQMTEALFGEVMPDSWRAALQASHCSWRDRLALWHAPRDAESALGHVACNVVCIVGWREKFDYLRAYLQPGKRHLGEIYAGRHAGWEIAAHIKRAARAVGRGIAS